LSDERAAGGDAIDGDAECETAVCAADGGEAQAASCSGHPRSKAMPIWQPLFYDFNVWTEGKRLEKLSYRHRNPIKRGLVSESEQ
jgi:hypothetical protein